MKEIYVPELQKLANGLIERGIDFTFREFCDGGQIISNAQEWDAICHDASYGRESGLLEIMGALVNREKTTDSVEGFLTAQEILDRIDEMKGAR